jgi:hypothetical protein
MLPSTEAEATEYSERTASDDLPSNTRVIAVVLSEEEWRACRAIEPDPLAWLQQQIRARIESATPYEDDDY